MTKEELLETKADFYWCYGKIVFISTLEGNYLWSTPDFYGDNSITKFEGSIHDYLSLRHILQAESRGTHLIKDYCGVNFKLVEEEND